MKRRAAECCVLDAPNEVNFCRIQNINSQSRVYHGAKILYYTAQYVAFRRRTEKCAAPKGEQQRATRNAHK